MHIRPKQQCYTVNPFDIEIRIAQITRWGAGHHLLSWELSRRTLGRQGLLGLWGLRRGAGRGSSFGCLLARGSRGHTEGGPHARLPSLGLTEGVQRAPDMRRHAQNSILTVIYRATQKLCLYNSVHDTD